MLILRAASKLTIFIVMLIINNAKGKALLQTEVESNNEKPMVSKFDTCKSLNSSNRAGIECSDMQEASNFALLIGSTEFKEDEDITVRVVKTKCPTPGSNGTKWYAIEVSLTLKNDEGSGELFRETTQQDNGKLKPRFQQNDVYDCSDDGAQSVLFYPCEPSWYNFPGRFTWTAPGLGIGTLIESVCFRLTAVEEGSTTCETIEKCIKATTNTNDDSEVEKDPLDQDDYDYDSLINESDDKQVIDVSSENSEQSPYDIINLTCNEDRRNYQLWRLPWIPQCDCQGNYLPVQCIDESYKGGSLSCWCSTIHGVEIAATRANVKCDNSEDPTEFELSCLSNL